ncbi:MAG: universal stress protein [Nitrospirae bacterium]|nr:universal stress protein [Nitrospirota bacterium]
MFDNILVPTDFSPFSRMAEKMALDLAKESRGKLLLLHVIDPYFERLPYLVSARLTRGKVRRGALDQMRKELKWVRAPGVKVESRVASGSPPEAILRSAKDFRADLIVLGTHGRTGIEHLLLGSVAEKILRLAPCPVLTLRKNIPEEILEEL